MGPRPHCYLPSHRVIGPLALEGFYHIWAWRPSWSCEPDPANKLSYPPIPWRLHRKFGFDWPSGFGEEYLKMVDGRTTDGRWTMAHVFFFLLLLVCFYKHLYQLDQQALGVGVRHDWSLNIESVCTFGWSLDTHLCKRALLSMFYIPDRSGSTTVTFSKYIDSIMSWAKQRSKFIVFVFLWQEGKFRNK